MEYLTTTRRRMMTVLGAAAATTSMQQLLFAQTTAPINFGFQDTSWGTIGMIAEAQHLFQKVGANVKIFKFDSGTTTRDAMIAERIDIGVIGATPFVIGASKGQMGAVAVALYGGNTLAVVGGVKAKVKTVTDLKGRKVGSQIGSATDYIFQNKIMPKYGLSKSDIQIINIPFQNHVAALAAGSIEGFAGVEPFPSVAQVEKIGRVLVDYSAFDLQPIMLAANESVLQKKPAAVVAFLRGWLLGVKQFKDHSNQANAIILKYFKDQGFAVTPEVIKLMLSKLDVDPHFAPQIDAYLDDEAKVLMSQHKIESIPDWTKLLRHDLLQQAEQENG